MKAMHVESIHKDLVWEKVKESYGEYVYFVVTPVNYDYVKLRFDPGPREEWEGKILERYKWLKDKGCRIELHIHLLTGYVASRIIRSIKLWRLGYSYQFQMIQDGKSWLENNGFKPTEFVPGWWLKNEATEKAVKELGLKLVNRDDYEVIHDFELI